MSLSVPDYPGPFASNVRLEINGNGLATLSGPGVVLPTLADSAAAAGSVYLSSSNLDANGDPRLCRKGPSGNVTVIG